MNADGFAGVCASDKKTDVETYVGRLVYHLGLRIATYPACQALALHFAAQVQAANCVAEPARPIYDEMVAKIREDAKMPGSWVTNPMAPKAAPVAPPPAAQPTPPPVPSPAFPVAPAQPPVTQESHATFQAQPPAAAQGGGVLIDTGMSEPPKDKNAAAAARKAQMDANMKERQRIAEERRAAAKAKASALKAAAAEA